MRNVLVTGGAGYIGSHTAKYLAECGSRVSVYDNLSRGNRTALKWGEFIEGDIRDTPLLISTLERLKPEAVIHFAAYAYVGESVEQPAAYYDNNVVGTLSLLRALCETKVNNLVVSSTCATYGQPEQMPITEDITQKPINPYGFSKLVMENMCRDFENAHGIKTVSLRYFNAAGCDPSGEIGEIHDPEPHLIPRAILAALGEIGELCVFGNDYATPDGTCVRDYVHVNDLAAAHVLAVKYLLSGGTSTAFNLGTGAGISVRQIVSTVERIAKRNVPVRYVDRRIGDPAVLIADPYKANVVLGWKPRLSSVDAIVSSAWNWFSGQHAKKKQVN